uniref:Phage protein n=1 Tax=Steinernema glaseri TaxID=37863 RepID=A0A1I7ZUN9_9BILA
MSDESNGAWQWFPMLIRRAITYGKVKQTGVCYQSGCEARPMARAKRRDWRKEVTGAASGDNELRVCKVENSDLWELREREGGHVCKITFMLGSGGTIQI